MTILSKLEGIVGQVDNYLPQAVLVAVEGHAFQSFVQIEQELYVAALLLHRQYVPYVFQLIVYVNVHLRNLQHASLNARRVQQTSYYVEQTVAALQN